MARLGFHASHEQASPRQLLRDVQHAEQAGFACAMSSDHIAPWSARQGHSGNTWVWLGAALATTALPIGTLAIPGARYHPVVLAHHIATLAQLFPGRFWAALGSGEAMNEHVTGAPWPPKEQRVEHLEAATEVISRLQQGEEVSRDGTVTVDRARLWDVPDPPAPLRAAAISAESAARAAAWADGLVTVVQPVDALRRLVTAYREAGGGGSLALQLHLSWAPDRSEAPPGPPHTGRNRRRVGREAIKCSPRRHSRPVAGRPCGAVSSVPASPAQPPRPSVPACSPPPADSRR